ncbi:hypothetical protein Pint_13097 [Pistacia integerrima]|uniref:Uncharacterized protein n=1 Tax=Pistacia integerrima TaxID=434235 RepID=A0ACC0Y8X3_9ROSI|nr:hypothetical protein Pint_13097 [Pistacia integerrima]
MVATYPTKVGLGKEKKRKSGKAICLFSMFSVIEARPWLLTPELSSSQKSSKRTLKKTLEPSLRSFSFSLRLNLLFILLLLSPSPPLTCMLSRSLPGFLSHLKWATPSSATSRTLTMVSTLVEGGDTCVGKTVVDELDYSINGVNKHYGTPTNLAAYARVPGGSCTRVVVAVAANLVDFFLSEFFILYLLIAYLSLTFPSRYMIDLDNMMD